MKAFMRYVEAEQPRVNALLREEASKLDPVVRPVVDHVLDAGGKRLRPVLTLLTARSMGYDAGAEYPLACAMEFLHSATLLHDDILDGSHLRRGRPSAHTLFGHTLTVLAGDVLLALANHVACEYNDPRITACMAEGIMRTAEGEAREIAQMRNPDLTLDEYIEIITGKTAYLIQASTLTGALLAGVDDNRLRAASAFGLNLGVAFQLVDDALDYSSSAEEAGKPVGADLREGKLTMPCIYYLQSLDAARREEFARALRDDGLDEEAVKAVVLETRRAGHDVKTREFAGKYLDKAARALDEFPSGEQRDLLAQALAFIQSREK